MSVTDRSEYENIIDRISTYAQSLQDDNDRRMVQLWINRLSQENQTSPARHNRNLYARYLKHQLQHQSLRFPFTEPPPQEELQPLAERVYGNKYQRKSTGRYLHTVSSATYETCLEPEPKEEVQPEESATDITKDALAQLGPDVPLTQFVAIMSPYTTDNGLALQKTMHRQLDQFRSFVERMLQVRNRDFADLLFKQHAIKMDHYSSRQEMLYNELRRGHAKLFKMVPDWSWERYKTDPSYIKNIFSSNKTADDKFLAHETLENFTMWEEEVKQKLSLLQQLITNLEKENQELTDILYIIRQTSYDRQTMDCLTGQMQYENNLGLYSQVKLLRSERYIIMNSIKALEKELGKHR